ncbi:MAG: AAA family ATPase [Prevotella sp.]|nr:AAA family ATPase [Prevotella sp.]
MTTKNYILDKANYEQQQAYNLVANTNNCLFITGEAGTGKTTFIKLIQEKINKQFLVLAPTGIAAIAVGGQTIHSFFGFPLEVIGPHTNLELSYNNQMVLEKTDTIIIDEVSMVRSDIIDGMDRCLRMAFHTNMPFGGKQIIFVGDLFQLPPVVKRASVDEEMLHDLYGSGTPFFYKARVLKRMNLPKIEFKKVYRQNDEDFVHILNNMRRGRTNAKDLELLNSRVCSKDDIKQYSVILTAYNSMAEKINDKKLNALEGEEYHYQAVVNGTFKRSDSPAPETLRLKIGAQVIFCRNDYNNNCANGTIAIVVALTEDEIRVRLENGKEINVGKTEWESEAKVYNKESRKIESEVVGSFIQYPLKLAWAITIHKSQGMSFDRMHFDLTRGIFVPGQAYVAISRMRSLEGLSLSNPIMPHHITQNPEILSFSNSFNDTDMITDELESGKKIYPYLSKKDYTKATQTCLELVLEKISKTDYRNAAIMAKKMFDIMLDDTHLLGKASDVSLIKTCSITCDFLNSVICLYGNREDEAIGYANMVLARKMCIEAMYVKGRALFELKKYEEAYDMCYQIITEAKKAEEKKAIDMKQLLFEAKVNEKIGNPNRDICKELINICPECEQAYLILRKEILNKDAHTEVYDNKNTNNIYINTFHNTSIDNADFLKLVKKRNEHRQDYREFLRNI